MLGLGSQIRRAHHQALQHAVVEAGGADARVRARDARDLGLLVPRRAARLPRRVLPAHPDDAVLHSRGTRKGAPRGTARRRRSGHDRGRRRGRRRSDRARVHHGALPARGDPARSRARARQGGSTPAGLRDHVPGVPSCDAAHFEEQTRARRQQVAFYASTPAYRGVLDLHGWGELQRELNRMSKLGRWVEMGEQIGEDVLDAFAVESRNAKGVAQGIVGRFGDLDRLNHLGDHQPRPDRERELIEAFGAARGREGRRTQAAQALWPRGGVQGRATFVAAGIKGAPRRAPSGASGCGGRRRRGAEQGSSKPLSMPMKKNVNPRKGGCIENASSLFRRGREVAAVEVPDRGRRARSHPYRRAEPPLRGASDRGRRVDGQRDHHAVADGGRLLSNGLMIGDRRRVAGSPDHETLVLDATLVLNSAKSGS